MIKSKVICSSKYSLKFQYLMRYNKWILISLSSCICANFNESVYSDNRRIKYTKGTFFVLTILFSIHTSEVRFFLQYSIIPMCICIWRYFISRITRWGMNTWRKNRNSCGIRIRTILLLFRLISFDYALNFTTAQLHEI